MQENGSAYAVFVQSPFKDLQKKFKISCTTTAFWPLEFFNSPEAIQKRCKCGQGKQQL
jgi:hypothetical protein